MRRGEERIWKYEIAFKKIKNYKLKSKRKNIFELIKPAFLIVLFIVISTMRTQVKKKASVANYIKRFV